MFLADGVQEIMLLPCVARIFELCFTVSFSLSRTLACLTAIYYCLISSFHWDEMLAKRS